MIQSYVCLPYILSPKLQNTNEIDYQIGHTRSHKANVVLVYCWFTVTTVLQEVQTDIRKIFPENGSSHKKYLLVHKLQARCH